MRTLLKNGTVVNVFTDELEQTNVLLEDGKIIGVGAYTDEEADVSEDIAGKYLCPGFIDGHIHIESTMLTPAELAKVCLPHGTTGIVADPHEIANVCGTTGISFMLEMSKKLPMTVYLMLPSCVPATMFDESGAVLTAADLEPFYESPRVLGLAEMMNYPGVLAGDKSVHKKIAGALNKGVVIDGHAPLLSGKALDRYIGAGIQSDHECSTAEEAIERIRKGQWVMIRQGTAARNLAELLPLFEEPYNHRCLLVTDDRHPADLLRDGHIDHIIRLAVKAGKSPVTAIRMATLQAAQCFGLKQVGAIAPGYQANLLVLSDLNTVKVCDVYHDGKKVVENGSVLSFEPPRIREQLWKSARNSFYLDPIRTEDFHIEEKGSRCRIIKLIPDQLLTEEWITDICWGAANGIDLERDILKLAVIERHMNTGHRGLGFISGVGLRRGAIASSVSHDSHNLIVIGTNDADMAAAAEHVRLLGGGSAVVADGELLADMPLPIAGLMTDVSAAEIAEKNEKVREAVYALGVPTHIEPFMSMAFVSLPVIPALKMSPQGLVDVNRQERVSLYVQT
ncbi:MAG: adenine deaminase [Lachnospiraceae bacterium]